MMPLQAQALLTSLLVSLVLAVASPAWADSEPTALPSADMPKVVLSYTRNQVQPLFAAQDAFAARLDLVEHAEYSIELQSYLYHDDKAGRLLADAFVRAADRGVKVRVLVDDVDGRDARLMRALDAHPNIEIRRYNPFRLHNLRLLEAVIAFGRVDRRMHNKQLMVDKKFSIVGGRNIGDEYFGTSTELAFADLDILVAGPVVADLEQSFEAYWSSSRSKRLGRRSADDKHEKLAEFRQQLAEMMTKEGGQLQQLLEKSAFSQARTAGKILQQECLTALLADSPEKRDSPHSSEVAGGIAQTLRHARKDMFLLSSYFVPGEKGTETLETALAHKVGVQVITNSLASTDVAAVHAGYMRYRERLLASGAMLWEVKPVFSQKGRHHFSFGASSLASFHTKAYFFDQRYLFIGSFNMDPRSVALNTEMGLLFDCPELTWPLQQELLAALPDLAYRLYLDEKNELRWEEKNKDGVRTFRREPKAGLWRRSMVWWLKWLPIEREL